MNKPIALLIAAAFLTMEGVACAANQPTVADSSANALFDTVAALDTAVFDAFNHCSDPAQLQRHASYFAPDVEFYHDTGGVTWTRRPCSRTPQTTSAAIFAASWFPAR